MKGEVAELAQKKQVLEREAEAQVGALHGSRLIVCVYPSALRAAVRAAATSD